MIRKIFQYCFALQGFYFTENDLNLIQRIINFPKRKLSK